MAFQRVAGHENGAVNLPAELEGSARVVHPALVEIGRCRDGECCFEVRRTTGCQQVLCGTEIGLPRGAHFAVSPGEAGGPFNRIVSIRHFPDQSVIFLPFGRKTPARVLHNHTVAALDKGPCCTDPLGWGLGPGSIEDVLLCESGTWRSLVRVHRPKAS